MWRLFYVQWINDLCTFSVNDTGTLGPEHHISFKRHFIEQILQMEGVSNVKCKRDGFESNKAEQKHIGRTIVKGKVKIWLTKQLRFEQFLWWIGACIVFESFLCGRKTFVPFSNFWKRIAWKQL